MWHAQGRLDVLVAGGCKMKVSTQREHHGVLLTYPHLNSPMLGGMQTPATDPI
jgi:hypothetical protein